MSNSAKISWPVALTLVVLILVGAGLFVFWRLETWPARTVGQGTDELERLGKDLRSAFIDMDELRMCIAVLPDPCVFDLLHKGFLHQPCHPGRSGEAAQNRDLLPTAAPSRSRTTPLRGSPG